MRCAFHRICNCVWKTQELPVIQVLRLTSKPNRAFENGRADKQRVFALRQRRRAAQRERYTRPGAERAYVLD
jgi:hypothetical protein